MTKEQFENYKGTLHCKNCMNDVPKIHISHRRVYQNGDIAHCNVCDWIKRHNGVPFIDGFTEDEVKVALYFFIYEKSSYINDLAENIGKSIEETIKLFHSLKIGNKKCLVKSTCEYCGREIENFPNVYEKTKYLYCSESCYWKDKPNKMPKGKYNQFYKRIETNCTNCNKPIEVIPYDYNTENEYGDNHNFCCQQCYWEYRSKYYIGEKSISANREFTKEQREKARLTILKNCRSASRFDSGIQLKTNDLLDKDNINYEREYIIKYYAVDNYLQDFNLIIEVMGDYWHGNPLRYNENKYSLNEMQQRTILKDKQKKTYILNHNNINILYLWETDINKNPELCELLILEYIKNNGHLENYHSFNWEIKDGSLFLCDKLITPYQDMSSDKYKHLIKKKVG